MPQEIVKNYAIFLEHTSKKMGFQVARDENGNLLYHEGVAPFTSEQIYSGKFSTESVNANVDVPVSFDDWHHGAGAYEVDLVDADSHSLYNYSQGIDTSWPRRMYLSPELQTGGGVTGNPIKFLSATLGLFMITDRYAYEWTGAAWTERFDNGGSVSNKDIIEYTNSTANYLIIGTTDDYYISTNGTSWSAPGAAGAYPTYRGKTEANGSSVTTILVDKPTGAIEGDVLFAQIVIGAAETITPPSGWTDLGSSGLTVGASRSTAFYKQLGSSEPAQYQFSWSSAVNCTAVISCFTGVESTAAFYDQINVDGTPLVAGTSNTSDSGTVAIGNGRTVVQLGRIQDVSTGGETITNTTPAGYTEASDYCPANSLGAQVLYKENVSAGSVATVTATTSVTVDGAVMDTVVLVPPSGASVPNGLVRFVVRGASSGEAVLWGINDKGELRNTINPAASAAWSNASDLQLGEESVTVGGLEVINNTFYFITNKGITSYNETDGVATVWENDGLEYETNAARPYVWVDNLLYMTYSGSLFRYDPNDGSIFRAYPRGRQVGNQELNGTITAITGDSRNMYLGIKNSAGNFYVLKCDPQHFASVEGETFMPVHSWAYRSTGDVYAMAVIKPSSDNFSTTNPQLVLGNDANGDYFILPKYGLRPEDDSAYRFDTNVGTIYGAWVDGGSKSYKKFLNVGTFVGENLSASLPAVFKYEIDSSGSPVTIATLTSSGLTNTEITATDVEYARIRYVVTLDTNVNTSSPRGIAAVFHSSLNPPRKGLWEVGVLVGDDLEMLGGGEARDGRKAQLTHLRNGLTKRVTFYDRDGNTFICKLLDYKAQTVSETADMYMLYLVELANP